MAGRMGAPRPRCRLAAALPGQLAVAALLTMVNAAAAQELVRFDRAWPVMGTLVQATALAPDTATARAAVGAAHDAITLADSLMSTWNPGTELSRLNDAAGDGRWIALSPESLEVIRAAIAWAERSDGAFDPTVGPLVRAWGFHGGAGRVPPELELDSLAALVGWRGVELGGGETSGGPAGAARLAGAGMELDLGAIAKGYAADLAVNAMARAGAVGGMVDLGGQVSVFGPAPDGGAGWPIGVRDPTNPKEILGRVTVDGGSVATSGDYERFFEVDGRRYSHLIDPRSGRPAEGIAQVTVVAPSGMDADALSTTLFVLGPEEGAAFLERWAPDATAIWIRTPEGDEIGEGDVVVSGAGAGMVDIE